MIRSFDYLDQYRALEGEIQGAIGRVLASGQLILGPEVEAFESEFAESIDVAGAVGVANGTDALAIALMALEIGPGDEVVTVANTAVPTVSAIREVGATPVFCEVDPCTALMDLTVLPQCLSARTRAVIPVHLYGNVVDVPRLRERLAGGVAIVEDCAQAHGATLRGQPIGSLGDVSAFSFYPTKNLGAMGDAGLCASSDGALLRKMRSLRQYGYEAGPPSVRDGRNSRLDELQAAILRVKLPHLASFVAARRERAARYDSALPTGVEAFGVTPDSEHARHLYVVQVDDRDGVRARLEEAGVGSGIHYRDCIHLMDAFRSFGCGPGSLPVTEALSERVLSLPLYPELSLHSADRVIAALADCVA